MTEKRILLVEDSEDDVELAVHALKQAGVASPIDAARDGEEALAYLFDRGDGDPLPVLVLLDLKLPKLDGFDVLERIRENDRTRLVPVVVLTSSDVAGDVVRAYELGANGFVRKPVDFAHFSDVLTLITRYWLDLNETASPERA